MKYFYLSRFDENGRRIETVMRSIHFQTDEDAERFINNEGYEAHSYEDWMYYVGCMGDGDNGMGYIRDPLTGRPVSAPAHVKTKSEQAQTLYYECVTEMNTITQEILNALADGDDDLVRELREEKVEIMTEYQENLKELL